MSKPLPHNPGTVYGVSFTTNEVKKTGHIKAVQVTLGHGVMDMEETIRVDLCDHPLYKDLERYVLANPSS